jgi:serine palmitoyltransferase
LDSAFKMAGGSPLPSPMALNNRSPTFSIFKKKSVVALAPKTAASYLSALSEADARRLRSHPPTATPALSLSSSVTSDSEDAILHENEGYGSSADGLEIPLRPPTSEQVFTTVHSEFGHCAREEFRYTSEHVEGAPLVHVEREPPYYIVISTFLRFVSLAPVRRASHRPSATLSSSASATSVISSGSAFTLPRTAISCQKTVTPRSTLTLTRSTLGG